MLVSFSGFGWSGFPSVSFRLTWYIPFSRILFSCCLNVNSAVFLSNMGISRLTTDLQPYLESAIIGTAVSDEFVKINSVVIDGPSMVYHVYNKILAYRASQAIKPDFCDVPPYHLLISSVLRFLRDLETCGATM